MSSSVLFYIIDVYSTLLMRHYAGPILCGERQHSLRGHNAPSAKCFERTESRLRNGGSEEYASIMVLTPHCFCRQIEAGNYWDELTAADRLTKFRAEQEHYVMPSFETISAFGSNGAVIHYKPSEKTKKQITKDSLYLLDSGGQYKGEDNLAFPT